MSLFSRLLCTCLPDVGSKYLAARSKHDVSSRVMSLQLCAPFSINTSVDCFANNFGIVGKGRLNLVEHTLANFDSINYLEDLINSFDC